MKGQKKLFFLELLGGMDAAPYATLWSLSVTDSNSGSKRSRQIGFSHARFLLIVSCSLLMEAAQRTPSKGLPYCLREQLILASSTGERRAVLLLWPHSFIPTHLSKATGQLYERSRLRCNGMYRRHICGHGRTVSV